MRSIRVSAAALVIAAVLAASGADGLAQPAAEPAPSVYKPQRVVLLDVARAGNRLVAVGERGLVMTSTDDGRSWQGQRTKVTRTLTGVAFADDKVGVAVGHGGSLLRTADGGASWTPVEVEAVGRDSLLGVTHLEGPVFAAYGAFGLYIESADGGVTWARRRVGGEDFDRHISQVVKVGPELLLVGESASLARSADRGANWQKMESPYHGSFFGALATAKGSVLAYGMRGNVYRSTDGMKTWAKVELPTAAALMGSRQLDDGTIVLVGGTGVVAVSRDDGASFRTAADARGRSLSQVIATGSRDLIVVGEGGIATLDRGLWAPK